MSDQSKKNVEYGPWSIPFTAKDHWLKMHEKAMEWARGRADLEAAIERVRSNRDK